MLFPTPDYYLYNLKAMTSSEAKRLWRRAIKEHFGNTCIYCGKSYESHELTIDHVHPKCMGGTNDTKNSVCACRKCNQDKGSEQWLSWMRDKHGFNPLREQLILEHIN
tara:strand:+ start:153 stop:476 length:324 start_codon:yes stop_codon:yes gene_type:complete